MEIAECNFGRATNQEGCVAVARAVLMLTTRSLGLVIAQGRYYAHALGPKVGIMHILVALGYMVARRAVQHCTSFQEAFPDTFLPGHVPEGPST